MSWLDPLLAIKTQQAGTTAGTRQTINFASGATVVDDPANDRVNVTITGTGITQLTGDVTAGPGSGSIAATVAKVNGVSVTGTPSSGQVIRATSGTASSWANVARGDIANTSGATGDLITGNATTLGRLAIGSTGQVLTVSGGAPVWSNPGQSVRTTYELDFTTQTPGTVLSGVGPATAVLGGLTWTFTADNAANSAVIDNTGLILTNVGSSGVSARVSTSSCGVYDAIQGNWRISLYNSVFDPTNETWVSFSLAGYSGNAANLYVYNERSRYSGVNPNFYGYAGPTTAGALIQKISSGVLSSNNVLMIECVAGNIVTRSGAWSSGWPSLSACLVHTIGAPSSAAIGQAGLDVGSTVFDFGSAGTGNRINKVSRFRVEVW